MKRDLFQTMSFAVVVVVCLTDFFFFFEKLHNCSLDSTHSLLQGM